MQHGPAWWIGFNALVLVMILIDLLVFHKRDHKVSVKEALIWTGVWITLALIFDFFIYKWFGKQAAAEYLAGYLLEKSLSVDNLFVFIIIFSFFKVPDKFQHRVLFYGILVAMILRAAFILAGTAIVQQFEWVLYIFGVMLLYLAWKMIADKDEEYDVSDNPVLRFIEKTFKIREGYKDHAFFVKVKGQVVATRLFVVLIVINFVDVVFAVDSIPAIFGITTDSFIVYTSNIFAILGLRALYFAIAGVMGMFHYLKYGLAVLLGFIGIKLLIAHWVKIPTAYSLGFILLVLAIAIVASIMRDKRLKKRKR